LVKKFRAFKELEDALVGWSNQGRWGGPDMQHACYTWEIHTQTL